MGKVDQGVIVLWLARHYWADKELSYIGYGGKGKQVRDFMHIDDLYEALKIQLDNIALYSGKIFNLGGGKENSLSLAELTDYCQSITKNKIKIESVKENRPNDVRIYISDCRKFNKLTGWKCKKNAEKTLTEIYGWINEYEDNLKNILK